MIVCQYFLQGRCRYGQNCRFEHSYTNDERGNRIVINAQQLHDVLRRITEEVMIAEKGGQWPLSCFAPLRGKPNFPGFEDVSPEELRWKTYQAKANGTWDQCLNEIKELYRNVERMRNRIMMPTKETLTLLVNVLKSKRELTPNTSPQPAGQNIFGNAQPASSQNVFGNSTQPTSGQNIFGNSMQSVGQNVLGNAGQPSSGQNIFGNPGQSGNGGNVLGSPTQSAGSQNIFGGSAQPANGQNVLGNASKSQGNIFGNSSFSGNVFGNSPQSTGNVFASSPTTGNVFGGSSGSSQNIFSPPSTQANVFGNASFTKQNIFGNSFSQNSFSNQGTTTTQNIFSTPATNAGNVFSSPPTQNVFSNFAQGAGQTTTPGMFQSQKSPFTQNSLFESNAQSQSQSNVFGQSENLFKSQDSFGGGCGVFGAPQGVESQKPNAMDSSVFSKLNDLSEEEVNAFKNAIFTFGKIPLKPPPQEFCN